MIDVATNEIKESTLQKILCADDLVIIMESLTELPEKILYLEKCT